MALGTVETSLVAADKHNAPSKGCPINNTTTRYTSYFFFKSSELIDTL